MPLDTSTWRCTRCGCTERHACPPTCWWVGPQLCSSCATPAELVRFDRLGAAALVAEVDTRRRTMTKLELKRLQSQGYTATRKITGLCRRPRCNGGKVRGKPFCMACWGKLSQGVKQRLVKRYQKGKPSPEFQRVLNEALSEINIWSWRKR